MGSTGNMGFNNNMIEIPLTDAQYHDLEKAMQWPEDMEAYEKLNKPLPLFGNIQND